MRFCALFMRLGGIHQEQGWPICERRCSQGSSECSQRPIQLAFARPRPRSFVDNTLRLSDTPIKDSQQQCGVINTQLWPFARSLRMADPWVRPTSPGPPDSGIVFRPESEQRPASGKTHSPDDYLLIDRLREDAAAGRMDLDSILSEATHAARYFTDATGAALALWSQGVVICRARSGDSAPPLGAKVDVDAGISGECLRSGSSQRCNDTQTDPRVDAEVCEELGIRALAAVPLRGGQGVIGILEVFSDRPNAFSDAHISLLKKLAKIAVMGRAKGITPATPTETLVQTEPPPLRERLPKDLLNFDFLPARMRGEEGQPIRLVAAAVLLIVLGFFGWMLTRSR